MRFGRVCVPLILRALRSTELRSSSLLVMTHPGTAYPGPVDKVDAVEHDPTPEASAVLSRMSHP